MGSFEQLAGMLPGHHGKQKATAELAPNKKAHTAAILLSMPPAAAARFWTAIACSSSLR